VRVVNEDGQQLGVMATEAAKDIARRVGLDLVEISPQAKPPVCKIMDYGRYKYEMKKKAATARKAQHQIQVKEIKFRPRISDHDLDFKLKSARKFLMEGDKVKCRVMFRGREIVYKELGRDLLNRVAQRLEEISTVEQAPQMEGRILFFTLAPNRAGIERVKKQEAARIKAEQEAEGDSAAPVETEPAEGSATSVEAEPAEGSATPVEAEPAEGSATPVETEPAEERQSAEN
jgi:translation initiation factor IF-3